MHRAIFLISVMLAVSGCSALRTVDTNHFVLTRSHYDEMTKGPNPSLAGLTLFFAGMPKGGDIHHHYSGSIYAESYLDWVEKKGCWINKETFKIEKQQSDLGITVQTLRDNPELYRGLLRLWSSKDYSNHYHVQSAPDHQFFSTFGYFGPIADADYREGLIVLKERGK